MILHLSEGAVRLKVIICHPENEVLFGEQQRLHLPAQISGCLKQRPNYLAYFLYKQGVFVMDLHHPVTEPFQMLLG